MISLFFVIITLYQKKEDQVIDIIITITILSQLYTLGYWLYKPYVIMHYLSLIASPDDIVCYMDSMYEFVENIIPMIESWTAEPPYIGVALNKPDTPTFIEKYDIVSTLLVIVIIRYVVYHKLYYFYYY